MRLIFFFSKHSEFNVDFRRKIKNPEKVLVLAISAFELVAVNSAYSNENTCNRESLC